MPVHGLPIVLECMINNILEESELISYKIAGNVHQTRTTLVLRFDAILADVGLSAKYQSTPAVNTSPKTKRKSASQIRRDRQRSERHYARNVTNKDVIPIKPRYILDNSRGNTDCSCNSEEENMEMDSDSGLQQSMSVLNTNTSPVARQQSKNSSTVVSTIEAMHEETKQEPTGTVNKVSDSDTENYVEVSSSTLCKNQKEDPDNKSKDAPSSVQRIFAEESDNKSNGHKSTHSTQDTAGEYTDNLEASVLRKSPSIGQRAKRPKYNHDAEPNHMRIEQKQDTNIPTHRDVTYYQVPETASKNKKHKTMKMNESNTDESTDDTAQNDTAICVQSKPLDDETVTKNSSTNISPASNLLTEDANVRFKSRSACITKEDSTKDNKTKRDIKSNTETSLSKPEEVNYRIDGQNLFHRVVSSITLDLARDVTQDQCNNEILKLMLDDAFNQNLILAETDDFVIEYCATKKMIANFIVKDNDGDNSYYYYMRTRHVRSFPDETEYIQREYKEDVKGILSLLPHLKQNIMKVRMDRKISCNYNY